MNQHNQPPAPICADTYDQRAWNDAYKGPRQPAEPDTLLEPCLGTPSDDGGVHDLPALVDDAYAKMRNVVAGLLFPDLFAQDQETDESSIDKKDD